MTQLFDAVLQGCTCDVHAGALTEETITDM